VAYYRRIIKAVRIPVIVQDASGYVGRPISLEMQARLLDEFGPERVLYKPEANPIGPRLTELREATGGRALFPFKMKDITHSFAAIEDELRSQYVVSYKPADFDADGRYRSIEISTLKKDLQVRARKGYFAPQQ